MMTMATFAGTRRRREQTGFQLSVKMLKNTTRFLKKKKKKRKKKKKKKKKKEEEEARCRKRHCCEFKNKLISTWQLELNPQSNPIHFQSLPELSSARTSHFLCL